MKKALSMTLTFLIAAFLILMPVMAQEGPDENEPNDSLELADEISGLSFTGTVGEKGDTDDWFELTGQEGVNPGFTLYYDDSVCDIDLEVWSNDEVVGTLSATQSPDYSDFYVPNTCWVHVWAHSGHGEYTVEIISGDDTIEDNEAGPCQGLDEVESNDERDLADLIENFQFEGYVCEDDVDWFVLNGQEGFSPTITLIHDDSLVSVAMEVYSDDKLVGSLKLGVGMEYDQFDIPSTCYLKVFSRGGEGWYMVEINAGGGSNDNPSHTGCEGLDENEPNDTMDIADSIDGFEIAGYACDGDADWFELTGQEGTNPTIVLYYDSDVVDVDMDIYSGDEIAGSLTSGDNPDQGTFDVPDTCYLKVYSFSGEGDYHIEILPEGGANGSGSDCEGTDEHESNDTRGLADTISAMSFDGYACTGEDDWFALQGQEGTYPTFTIYYDDNTCDIDIEIYSSDDFAGSLTASSSPDTGSFDVPDTCYLRIYSASGEGAYTIEIVS